MRVYLAGAIEAAPDGGKTWRNRLRPILQNEFSAQVFDPTIEEPGLLSPEEREAFREWKVTDYKRFSDVISRIIDYDLDHLLNHTDLVICLWDEYVVGGGGTQGELTLAHHFNIPVYLVLGMPIRDVSSWILGCSSEVFENFDELLEMLRKAPFHKDSQK